MPNLSIRSNFYREREASVAVGWSTEQRGRLSANLKRENVSTSDSAASQHMLSDREGFTNLGEYDEPTTVVIGNSTEPEGAAVGAALR